MCPICGNKLTGHQKYCSNKCRQRGWFQNLLTKEANRSNRSNGSVQEVRTAPDDALTFKDFVDVMNNLYNDRLLPNDPLAMIPLVFGEERGLVFDQDSKRFIITVPSISSG
jgi:hypothetical protein